jgi:hypothetical protein
MGTYCVRINVRISIFFVLFLVYCLCVFSELLFLHFLCLVLWKAVDSSFVAVTDFVVIFTRRTHLFLVTSR